MTISTNDQWELKKQRLADVPAGELAEALLDLAARSEVADATVERLVATPDEAISRFKSQLAGIRRRRRFVDWRGASDFAYELSALLDGLTDGVQEARTGVELAASFFKADGAIMEQCDDSSGSVGDVFRHDAAKVFAHFASQCADKQWVVEIILDLMSDDNYGVRDAVIECADQYLSPGDLNTLVDHMWERTEKASDEYRGRNWLFAIESIARQIKDPALFEKARRRSWGKLSVAAYLDIAQVHFDAGDAQSALEWLQKAKATDTFKQYERDELMLKIFETLGDQEQAGTQAKLMFDYGRTRESLDRLLAIVGQESKPAIIEEACNAIRAQDTFSSSDTEFLLDVGCLEDAEEHVLRFSSDLNGQFYTSLLPIATTLAKRKKILAATMVYRALLESILARAISKYYTHGVRYLRRLDQLATKVDEWHGHLNHAAYMAQLKEDHGRKHSFWKRYEE